MPRSSLLNLLLLIVIIAVAWFGVWSFFQDSRDLRSSIRELEQSIEEERAALVRLEELEQTLELRKEEVEKLEIGVPPVRDTASIIAALEEAANVNGLALTGLNIIEPERGQRRTRDGESAAAPATSGINTFNAQIELSGRYRAFRSFLVGLESAFPLMDGLQFSFRPPLEDQDENVGIPVDPLLEYQLIFEAYYVGIE